MTLKPPSNGPSLPKAPFEKSAFIAFSKRLLHLQPDCSVIDLDNPANCHDNPPKAPLGVWIDSWHNMVDALGSSNDAELGVRTARSILYDLSTRFDSMLFSADTSRPPLDQFGSPGRSLEMLFRESTCYELIQPVAFYRGRKVYLGCNPRPTEEKLDRFVKTAITPRR